MKKTLLFAALVAITFGAQAEVTKNQAVPDREMVAQMLGLAQAKATNQQPNKNYGLAQTGAKKSVPMRDQIAASLGLAQTGEGGKKEFGVGRSMASGNKKLAQTYAQAEQCVLGALPEPDLSWCGCDVSPPPPQGGSGATSSTVYNTNVNVASGQTTSQVPNHSSSEDCEFECCSCNASEQQSCEEATKTRDFTIIGNIRIAESIHSSGSGRSQAASHGEGEKVATCATTNSGASGTAPGGEICVDIPGFTAGSGGVVHEVVVPAVVIPSGGAAVEIC